MNGNVSIDAFKQNENTRLHIFSELFPILVIQFPVMDINFVFASLN